MSGVTDIDPADKRRYMQIALTLSERIASGELPSGAAMPGTRAIKEEFGVSIETAQKALRVLDSEGLIKKYPGLSYYVLGEEGG